MKVRREDHWKPQSPVREGGVVYCYVGGFPDVQRTVEVGAQFVS